MIWRLHFRDALKESNTSFEVEFSPRECTIFASTPPALPSDLRLPAIPRFVTLAAVLASATGLAPSP